MFHSLTATQLLAIEPYLLQISETEKSKKDILISLKDSPNADNHPQLHQQITELDSEQQDLVDSVSNTTALSVTVTDILQFMSNRPEEADPNVEATPNAATGAMDIDTFLNTDVIGIQLLHNQLSDSIVNGKRLALVAAQLKIICPECNHPLLSKFCGESAIIACSSNSCHLNWNLQMFISLISKHNLHTEFNTILSSDAYGLIPSTPSPPLNCSDKMSSDVEFFESTQSLEKHQVLDIHNKHPTTPILIQSPISCVIYQITTALTYPQLNKIVLPATRNLAYGITNRVKITGDMAMHFNIIIISPSIYDDTTTKLESNFSNIQSTLIENYPNNLKMRFEFTRTSKVLSQLDFSQDRFHHLNELGAELAKQNKNAPNYVKARLFIAASQYILGQATGASHASGSGPMETITRFRWQHNLFISKANQQPTLNTHGVRISTVTTTIPQVNVQCTSVNIREAISSINNHLTIPHKDTRSRNDITKFKLTFDGASAYAAQSHIFIRGYVESGSIKMHLRRIDSESGTVAEFFGAKAMQFHPQKNDRIKVTFYLDQMTAYPGLLVLRQPQVNAIVNYLTTVFLLSQWEVLFFDFDPFLVDSDFSTNLTQIHQKCPSTCPADEKTNSSIPCKRTNPSMNDSPSKFIKLTPNNFNNDSRLTRRIFIHDVITGPSHQMHGSILTTINEIKLFIQKSRKYNPDCYHLSTGSRRITAITLFNKLQESQWIDIWIDFRMNGGARKPISSNSSSDSPSSYISSSIPNSPKILAKSPLTIHFLLPSGETISWSTTQSIRLQDIKSFIDNSLNLNRTNIQINHRFNLLTEPSLRQATSTHPKSISLCIIQELCSAVPEDTQIPHSTQIKETPISVESDFEQRLLNPGPMPPRDPQGNIMPDGSPNFEEIQPRAPAPQWHSGVREAFDRQQILNRKIKASQKKKRELKKDKERRKQALALQKAKQEKQDRLEKQRQIDSDLGITPFEVSSSSSDAPLNKNKIRISNSSEEPRNVRITQQKSTPKKRPKRKYTKKNTYKRPNRKSSNFLGENPEADPNELINGIIFNILHQGDIYSYKCRHGEIIANILHFMKVRTGLSGALQIPHTYINLEPATLLHTLPSTQLNFLVDDIPQTDPSSTNEIPTILEGQTHIRIICANMHGLKSSTYNASEMLKERRAGILIGTDCMAKNGAKYGYPFRPVVNDENQIKYGTTVAVNHDIYPEHLNGDLNIDQSSTHAAIRFQSCTVVGMYLPKSNKKTALENLLTNVTNTTVIVGDANMDCRSPISDEDCEIVDTLVLQGFQLCDLNTDGTFIRVSPTDPSKIEKTTIDHCWIKNPDNLITRIKVHAIDDGLIFSDHRSMLVDIVLNTSVTDICINAKQARLRYHKFIPFPISVIKDGKNTAIDRNAPNREKYHKLYTEKLEKRRGSILQTLSEASNTNLSDKQRQDASNRAFNQITKASKTATNAAVGTTKHEATISDAELTEIARELKMGKGQVARAIISSRQKKIFREYRGENRQMDKAGYIKKLGNQRRRIKHGNGGSLNPNNIEQLINEWDDKWNLRDIQSKTDIIGPLPRQLKALPSNFTLEYFEKQIYALPNNKSPGLSGLSNEMIKYGPSVSIEILFLIFCNILTTGIIPDSWNNHAIIPVFKNKGTKYEMIYYRPICLMETLRKLMEGILLPIAKDAFPSTEDQYGFLERTSTLDAGHKLMNECKHRMKVANDWDKYSLEKWDIMSAFDMMKHQRLKEFIIKYVDCLILQYIFLSLMLVNNICLVIGSKRSRKRQISRGILQGSKLSPLFFIGLIDWALKQGPEVIRGLKLIYADDFLIMGLIEDRERNTNIAKRQLGLLGLSLSEDKSYTINSKDKWLGLATDVFGPNRELQIEQNLDNAIKRSHMMIGLGSFKGNYTDDPILAAFRSQVISIMEYGLAIHEPDIKLAERVDKMINRTIRLMLGIPIYFPIDDMRNLFQFGPFIDRWKFLNSRFQIHLATVANDPSNIKFSHPSPWKFTTRPCISKMMEKDISFRAFILRLYAPPTPDAICNKCKNHHENVNSTMQCYLKKQPFLIPKQPKAEEVENPLWLTLATTKQQQFITNNDYLSVDITVDASFEEDEDGVGYSNMGGIAISAERITTYQYKLDHLQIHDSTRAECCGIITMLNDFHNRNLVIHCDSQPAINTCIQYQYYEVDHTNFEHITNCDIVSQGKWADNNVQLEWVKGHSKNLLNNHCDLMAKTHNKYTPSGLQLNNPFPIYFLPKNVHYFRIRQLIFAEERKRLNPLFFDIKKEYHQQITMSGNGQLDSNPCAPPNSTTNDFEESTQNTQPSHSAKRSLMKTIDSLRHEQQPKTDSPSVEDDTQQETRNQDMNMQMDLLSERPESLKTWTSLSSGFNLDSLPK